MNDAEIIRHLAEKVMGWNVFDASSIGFPGFPVLVPRGEFWMFYSSKQQMGGRFWNALKSRCDCAEVEAALPEDARLDYIGYLECACVPGVFDYSSSCHQFALVTATARQRCLAMVEATK